MRGLRLTMIAMSMVSSVAAVAAEPCRYFDPAIETLTGRIEARSKDFGEPVPYTGGRRIHPFEVIVLDPPICVINHPSAPSSDDAKELELQNVTEVFLYWSPTRGGRHWVGRIVTLTGTLISSLYVGPYGEVGMTVHEAHAQGGKGKGRNRKPLEWRDPRAPSADAPPGITTPTEGAPRATPPAPRPQPPSS